jgi:hypothetical protein
MREAHPIDGWRLKDNDLAGIEIRQPRTQQERIAVASRCSTTLKLPMPVVVDDMKDRVGHLYSGMPDRLYVLDRDGRVVYKSGRGPGGFRMREMEQSLIMLLLDQPGRPSAKSDRP